MLPLDEQHIPSLNKKATAAYVRLIKAINTRDQNNINKVIQDCLIAKIPLKDMVGALAEGEYKALPSLLEPLQGRNGNQCISNAIQGGLRAANFVDVLTGLANLRIKPFQHKAILSLVVFNNRTNSIWQREEEAVVAAKAFALGLGFGDFVNQPIYNYQVHGYENKIVKRKSDMDDTYETKWTTVGFSEDEQTYYRLGRKVCESQKQQVNQEKEKLRKTRKRCRDADPHITELEQELKRIRKQVPVLNGDLSSQTEKEKTLNREFWRLKDVVQHHRYDIEQKTRRRSELKLELENLEVQLEQKTAAHAQSEVLLQTKTEELSATSSMVSKTSADLDVLHLRIPVLEAEIEDRYHQQKHLRQEEDDQDEDEDNEDNKSESEKESEIDEE